MSKKTTESQHIQTRRRSNGLISIRSKVQVRDSNALSLVYTPGVAEPCLEIARNPVRSLDVTCRGNTIAIVSNGTAVYGMGDVGPEAVLPILESQAIIMKNFAGVDALPLAIKARTIAQFVDTVINIAPSFGAICIEDVRTPEGLAITDELERALFIPVVNNHREGVAIGVLAGLINAAKVTGRNVKEMRVLLNGAGTAGLGTAYLLHRYGIDNVTVMDRYGAIYPYRPTHMNWGKWALSHYTNPERQHGQMGDLIEGMDAFIGFAGGGFENADQLTAEYIKKMAPDPIVFVLGDPLKIQPEELKDAGAAVVATAQSTYPNQMDISVVVPGIFRGLLDIRATGFPVRAQIAAAEAIAGIITDDQLHRDYIYPRLIDYRIAPAVARAVAAATKESGLYEDDRFSPEDIEDRTRRFVYEGKLPIAPKSDKPMTVAEESLELHERFTGLLEINSNVPIKDEFILKQFYLVPDVLEPTRIIKENLEEVFSLTARGNLVGVVSDGSAVLGLGNIGGRAAMPVMEGKAILFHTFAGVQAFPICVNNQETEQIIEVVKMLEPTFGGINLEDISAPRCFEIEERLKAETDIPIFHDDQHGTAVVALAGIRNATRLTGRSIGDLSVVVNGAGASAIAVTKLLMATGLEDVILVDSRGIIHKGRKDLNSTKREMAGITNPNNLKGSLQDAVKGRDVFIGLSVPGTLTGDMIKTMAPDPIIFALANPTPEIMPDEAFAAGAAIVATGRSDLPNQVNNSLAFPGIFRGALDTRVRNVTDEMKIAAAIAIADLVPDKELRPGWIIPKGTDFTVAPAVAAAVARKAIETGEARVKIDPAQIAARVRRFIYEE